MKALSVHPFYAMAIVSGIKPIECRTWATDYRGDILICSTAKKMKGTVPSHALGIVTLKNVRTFHRRDLEAAIMEPHDFRQGLFAWELENPRLIKPIPIKGKLSLWEYQGEQPEIIKVVSDEEGEQFLKDFWEPLYV